MTKGFTSGVIDATSIAEHKLVAEEVWDVELLPLASGRFTSRTRFFSTPRILAYHETWNRPICVRGGLRPGQIAFGLPEAEDKPFRLWKGDIVQSWTVPWLSSNQEVEMVSTEGYENTILVFSQELFAQVASQVTAGGKDSWTPSSTYLPSNPRRAREIRGLVEHLLSRSGGQNAPADSSPNAATRFEEMFIHALLTALQSDGDNDRPADLDSTPTQRYRRVQACLDYAAARGFQVSVPELCAVVGKSERTLRYAFQERLGVAPSRYLRLCRLGHCRRDLASARPDEATVTAVATRWGFFELGRFAADFHKVFGEKPSEVLRRSPGSTGDRFPSLDLTPV